MMEYGSPIQSQFNSVKDVEEIVLRYGKVGPFNHIVSYRNSYLMG